MAERQSTWRQFRALWPDLRLSQKVVFFVILASVIPVVVLLLLGYTDAGLGLLFVECVAIVLFDRWAHSNTPSDDGR